MVVQLLEPLAGQVDSLMLSERRAVLPPYPMSQCYDENRLVTFAMTVDGLEMLGSSTHLWTYCAARLH